MALRRAIDRSVFAALAVVLVSCSDGPLAATRASSGGRTLMAKAPAAPVVTSTNPPFGDQGTTVNVHVFGSGFAPDAQAAWLLHGVPNAAHVRTNYTTYVSPSEVIANITIAQGASLAFWDVQIALLGGKNGVGSELFEITSAQILGNGTLGGDAMPQAMNDQRQVVGYSTGGASTSFIYDDALGMVALGNGQAWGVDPLGTMALGRDASFVATAWVRQPDNRWVAETMPRLSGSVSSNAARAARAPDGTLLVAGWDATAGARKNDPSLNRPVLWRRIGTAWSPPQVLTLPAGTTKASAHDVNGSGQVVGQVEQLELGVVWDTPSTPVRLDGLANAINASGTLIVGHRGGAPAYWSRSAGGAWNTTGVSLPSIAGAGCTSGSARAVNSAGVIVGTSCNSGGKSQATVWRLDLSGPSPILLGAPTALPGLGDNRSATSETSTAAGVTDTAPYVAGGSALLNGTRLAVRWLVP